MGLGGDVHLEATAEAGYLEYDDVTSRCQGVGALSRLHLERP